MIHSDRLWLAARVGLTALSLPGEAKRERARPASLRWRRSAEKPAASPQAELAL